MRGLLGVRMVAKRKHQDRRTRTSPAKGRKTVVAIRRSTGGIGFAFDDFVSAWLLLQGLTGRQLPVEGQVQRVQAQTGSLRWDVDDVLLTAKNQTGERRLAVSCKGNV